MLITDNFKNGEPKYEKLNEDCIVLHGGDCAVYETNRPTIINLSNSDFGPESKASASAELKEVHTKVAGHRRKNQQKFVFEKGVVAIIA